MTRSWFACKPVGATQVHERPHSKNASSSDQIERKPCFHHRALYILIVVLYVTTVIQFYSLWQTQTTALDCQLKVDQLFFKLDSDDPSPILRNKRHATSNFIEGEWDKSSGDPFRQTNLYWWSSDEPTPKDQEAPSPMVDKQINYFPNSQSEQSKASSDALWLTSHFQVPVSCVIIG